MHHASVTSAGTRYATWEQSAGVTLAVVVTCFIGTLIVRVPGVPFVLLSLAGGALVFVSWRSSLAGRNVAALAAAASALVLALSGLSQDLNSPLPTLLAQGMSLVASGLFAGILICRRHFPVKSGDQ